VIAVRTAVGPHAWSPICHQTGCGRIATGGWSDPSETTKATISRGFQGVLSWLREPATHCSASLLDSVLRPTCRCLDRDAGGRTRARQAAVSPQVSHSVGRVPRLYPHAQFDGFCCCVPPSSGHVHGRPRVLRRNHQRCRAAPDRARRRCSHSCTFRNDTPRSTANCDWDRPFRSRMSAIAGSVVMRPCSPRFSSASPSKSSCGCCA
jgi:hypothetical protein